MVGVSSFKVILRNLGFPVRVLDFGKWHLRSCLRSPEVEKSCIPFEETFSESVISCLPYLCKFLPVRFADGDEKNRDVKLKNNWDAMYIEEQKLIRKMIGLVAVSFVSSVLSYNMFCQKYRCSFLPSSKPPTIPHHSPTLGTSLRKPPQGGRHDR